MAYIKLESVCKSFDGVPVINHLDLSLDKGCFCSIVGKSGIGKSTLLRMMGGFEAADHGQIIIDRNPIEKPVKEHMFIFQQSHQVFPWLNVRDNVKFPLKFAKGINKDDADKRVIKVLESVGLGHALELYPKELSGGMLQRVSLARALVTDPSILLMDEPFSALDYHLRKELQQLLLDIYSDQDCTVFFVTHDLEEAVKLSTHILVLKEEGGQLICCEGQDKDVLLERITLLLR